MNILQINSSIRGTASNSTRLASAIVTRLTKIVTNAKVEILDLGHNPHPQLDEAAVTALFTPAEQRHPDQTARIALDDKLIAQLMAADALVLGVPMYNFGIPVQLKAWIDAVARAGVTFRYTDKGPEGLVNGKKVYVGLARGGTYRDKPADSQVPYLKAVLGFLGLVDVEFIYAEGLALGQENADKSLSVAEAEISKLDWR